MGKMVETKLIVTIVIVAVVAIALIAFIIGTYATQTLLYAPYTRPPLANGVQPDGPARVLTQEEIDARNAALNRTG